MEAQQAATQQAHLVGADEGLGRAERHGTVDTDVVVLGEGVDGLQVVALALRCRLRNGAKGKA
jgi:hypothetical protein